MNEIIVARGTGGIVTGTSAHASARALEAQALVHMPVPEHLKQSHSMSVLTKVTLALAGLVTVSLGRWRKG